MPMDNFQITYQINPDDYAEASKLLRRHVKASPLARWGTPVVLIAVGLLPFINRRPDGSFDGLLVGLALFAAMLLFCSVVWRLPAWSRKFYKRIGVAGETYTAHFSAEDVLIESTNEQWRIKWAGFSVREESENVVMLYKRPLMYIFAKRFFTEEQLNSLREFLSALPPAIGPI
jgi:hypothetical protein